MKAAVEIGSDREDAPRAAQDGNESGADGPGAASLERRRRKPMRPLPLATPRAVASRCAYIARDSATASLSA